MSEGRDGRHARWDDHREQRRRHILDAAIEVVETAPVGAELTLADVADRAGLVRTVVQRHFGGTTGLVRAVQADVLRQAFARISGPLDDVRTLGELVERLVGQTVVWVRDHPALHNLVERDAGDGEPSELATIIGEYADFLANLTQLIATGFGVVLDERRLEEIRLLCIGIIAHVRAAVAHWARQDGRMISADELTDLLAGWTLVQVVAHSASYGVEMEASTSLDGLLATIG
ncbi:MAG: TetR/AcrR family transcriptional regulator [Nocardioidaceae bacterium]|nr:TetR/AcrR family transcriptional regulator [Nocardioidaceae bacterium]MCL2613411.1 TetR/AcrR family transcriptional regulator [Nocardioidaceae bacterium]